jgi:proline iminopeptidase
METETSSGHGAGNVEVQGAQLRYRIEGQGQTCLVIGSSIYYPRVFSQELRSHLRLVFVDLRHFAVCDPAFSQDRISTETYCHDIEQVRQILELGEVVVVGHSLAGTIALEYARRYPSHVRGVVAVGAPPYRCDEALSMRERFWEADASEERKKLLAHRRAELTPELTATLSPGEMFVRSYVADGPKHWYDPTYDDAWLWEGVAADWPVFDRLYNQLFKTYDLAQMPEITVPVLVAHGRYDYLIPHTFWDERTHKLPHHTYALFEHSGHTPSLEEPNQFDQTLLEWIRGLRPSQAP